MYTVLYFIGLTMMSISLWLTVPAQGLMMQGAGIAVYAVLTGMLKYLNRC